METARPTLVFTKAWDWFQLLVNISTSSQASHVAIGIGDNVLHVDARGVVLEPRLAWMIRKRQHVVSEVAIMPDVSDSLGYCLSKVGQPYDYPGILRAAIGIALDRMLSPLRSLGSAPDGSFTCAGFVMLLDPDGRIPEWKKLDRSVVTPADLLRAVGPSFRELW
jgi:hypothetical protein